MSVYTEQEIMKQAIKLVEEYGELSTTELKEILNEVMKPSGEDLISNLHRKDTKFDQKVRNMISHRASNELYKYFDYRKEGKVGILVSKTVASHGKEGTSSNNGEAQRKKEQARREKKKRFNARKIDFEEKNRRNKEIGEQGELFVFQFERQNLPSQYSEKVWHVSKEDGDGAGYDIRSYTSEGDIRFLEVKTTTGDIKTPFYLSENERLFIETYEEEAEIVRVYEFDTEKQQGKMYRINGKDFFESVELESVGYRVKLKK